MRLGIVFGVSDGYSAKGKYPIAGIAVPPMVEQVEYSVLSREGDVEFRKYPRVTVASVSGMTDNEAFGLLFDYISGGNGSSSEIPMTSPVISGTRASEELTMTAPVLSSQESFSFVMPAGRDASTLPAPKDHRITIADIPERTVAALRFRGRAGARQVSLKEAELLGVLKRRGVRAAGGPFLMRYNPPFMPGIFRRNEIAVEVMQSKGGA